MNAHPVVAAADLHQQHGLAQRVSFVVGVLVDDAHAVLAVLLGPVALLAGFARRAQVVHGRRNRPFEGIEGDREHLPRAGEFALDEPTRPRSDVTLDAFHPRVRRVLVGGELGLHHRVARLPAEGHRLHVGDSAIGELAGDDDVGKRGDADEDRQPPQLHVLPIQCRERLWIAPRLALAPPAQQDTQRNQRQPGEEKGR
ncbi:MAG: hypothetical protein BWY76_01729 [bacterium ADurb.Bin429]|nr:MAG: hypothetical protein BWY76_01729 [bacterium ADurb.Bin429]